MYQEAMLHFRSARRKGFKKTGLRNKSEADDQYYLRSIFPCKSPIAILPVRFISQPDFFEPGSGTEKSRDQLRLFYNCGIQWCDDYNFRISRIKQ